MLTIKNGGVNRFKDVLKEWFDKKTKHQIKMIDKLCLETGLDSKEWFYDIHLGKHFGQYSGEDIITDILDDFVYYLGTKFSGKLIKYLPDDMIGADIYNVRYVRDFETELYLNDKNKIKATFKKDFKKYRKIIPLSDREELMKNKLFSYVINQTKLKIYSKKEIRYLKIRYLNSV